MKPNAILMDRESRFPAEAVKKLAEMGLMGIPCPKEYGGAADTYVAFAVTTPDIGTRGISAFIAEKG